MTLDKAIQHSKEVSINKRRRFEDIYGQESVTAEERTEGIACLDCSEEHAQLASWLEELKARREADRWIPVSERLPDEYGNYLVFTSDNDIDIGTINPRTENGWSLCDANGFYWARQKGIEITHWKPLPKFYESEDK